MATTAAATQKCHIPFLVEQTHVRDSEIHYAAECWQCECDCGQSVVYDAHLSLAFISEGLSVLGQHLISSPPAPTPFDDSFA